MEQDIVAFCPLNETNWLPIFYVFSYCLAAPTPARQTSFVDTLPETDYSLKGGFLVTTGDFLELQAHYVDLLAGDLRSASYGRAILALAWAFLRRLLFESKPLSGQGRTFKAPSLR